jgi:hypothetical protein
MNTKPGVPEFWIGNSEELARKTAQVVNQLQKGLGNNAFMVNLADNETETVINVSFARDGQIAMISPQDSATAQDVKNGNLYGVVSNGKVTIKHDSSVGDRILGVVLQG